MKIISTEESVKAASYYLIKKVDDNFMFIDMLWYTSNYIKQQEKERIERQKKHKQGFIRLFKRRINEVV